MPALRPLLAATLLLSVLTGCGGKKSAEPAPSATPETVAAPASATSIPAPAPTAPATAKRAGTAGVSGALAGYIAGLDGIAMALESTKDEESALTAAAIITTISTRMQGLAIEVDKLPESAREKTFAAARQELPHVQARIAAAMQALGTKPELLALVGDAMKNVPKIK